MAMHRASCVEFCYTPCLHRVGWIFSAFSREVQWSYPVVAPGISGVIQADNPSSRYPKNSAIFTNRGGIMQDKNTLCSLNGPRRVHPVSVPDSAGTR